MPSIMIPKTSFERPTLTQCGSLTEKRHSDIEECLSELGNTISRTQNSVGALVMRLDSVMVPNQPAVEDKVSSPTIVRSPLASSIFELEYKLRAIESSIASVLANLQL